LSVESAESLDPQAKALLKQVEQSGAPLYHELDPIEARKLYELASQKLRGDPPLPFKVEEISIPGTDATLAATLYRPNNQQHLPALLFFHGGGFTLGSRKTHDTVCRRLCVDAECLVISVDYRLAPEARFPAAVDDAWAALNWLASNCAQLGIDDTRIAVGGDSAGGNLAAVISLMARDAGGPAIVHQMLVYPCTEMTCSFPSHNTFGNGYRLTNEFIAWFLDHYFGPAADRQQWQASPINAKDFSNLPPAFVLSAGFDPLQDENRAYAQKLREAGVPVQFSHYEGMIHGFITMPGVMDKAIAAAQECARHLRTAFQPEP